MLRSARTGQLHVPHSVLLQCRKGKASVFGVFAAEPQRKGGGSRIHRTSSRRPATAPQHQTSAGGGGGGGGGGRALVAVHAAAICPVGARRAGSEAYYRALVRIAGGPRGLALLLWTRLCARRLWRGRSVFSRATENGPAFRECFVCTHKCTAKCRPSWSTHKMGSCAPD